MLPKYDQNYTEHAENIAMIVGRLYDEGLTGARFATHEYFQEVLNDDPSLPVSWESVLTMEQQHGERLRELMLARISKATDQAVRQYLRLVGVTGEEDDDDL